MNNTRNHVAIIILQYNNSQDTIECLDFVKELDYPDFSVIVVDNASDQSHQDTTRSFLKNQINSAVRYYFLVNRDNLGYAGGNNKGIEFALAKSADYILILNPDVRVEKDLLTKLVAKADSSAKIGIVGPAIDEGEKIIYGGEIKWLKPELRHSERMPSANNFFISGAAMLIKREVVGKAGMFDEKYFLYFEDVDYCLKVRRAGYSLAVVDDAIVHHRVSAITGKLGPAALLYYHFRNAHLFNLKNTPWPAKMALPFWSFFIMIKQLIKIIFVPNKRQISTFILRGIIDFYRGKFGRLT